MKLFDYNKQQLKKKKNFFRQPNKRKVLQEVLPPQQLKVTMLIFPLTLEPKTTHLTHVYLRSWKSRI